MLPHPSPARIALGRTIRELRGRRGVSQEQLALRTRLQRKTIHQLETAKTDPRLETLVRVAAALDVSLTELVELAEELDGS